LVLGLGTAKYINIYIYIKPKKKGAICLKSKEFLDYFNCFSGGALS